MVNNDITMDAQALAEKQKVIAEQRTNAKLYSVAETFQFMAAALLPVGLAATISAANAMGGITIATFGAALATGAPALFLGAAAVCTAIAIGSRFAASKHFQNANFNSTELNAQHTAKYLAQELKSPSVSVGVEYPENIRSDGKQWTHVLEQQSAVSLTRH